MRRLRAVVHGRVQGVGFRASVFKRIVLLDVTGFVRNLPDGTVEIVAEGSDSVLNDVLDIAKEGSLYSKVDDIEIVYNAATSEFTDFSITY